MLVPPQTTSPQNSSISSSPAFSASSSSPFPASSAESCVEAAAGPVAVGDPKCARKNEEEAGELELAAHQPKAKERHVAIFEKEGAVFAVDGAGGIRRGNERQSEGVLCVKDENKKNTGKEEAKEAQSDDSKDALDEKIDRLLQPVAWRVNEGVRMGEREREIQMRRDKEQLKWRDKAMEAKRKQLKIKERWQQR